MNDKMKIYVDVEPETNRVLGWGTSSISQTSVEIEVDEGHEVLDHPFFYQFVDGQLVRDDEYAQKLINDELARKSVPSIEEQLKATQDALLTLMNLWPGGGA